MTTVNARDIPAATQALADDGFVILHNAISAQRAAELAQLTLDSPTQLPGVSNFSFAVNLLNHDLAFLDIAMHPAVLELVRHLIGGRTENDPTYFTWPPDDQVRIGSVDGLIAHPGCAPGNWHQDPPMGQLSNVRPLPDFPITVNCIWMLTPFNANTGATRVVPGSHKRRQLPPRTTEAIDEQIHAVGEPGSVVIVPNTMWHCSDVNQSDSPRVGAACMYQPWYVGRLTMDTYPIRPEVWQTLPSDAQAMTKHQLSWNTDFIREAEPR